MGPVNLQIREGEFYIQVPEKICHKWKLYEDDLVKEIFVYSVIRQDQECLLYSVHPEEDGNLLVESKFDNSQVPVPELYTYKWDIEDSSENKNKKLFLYAEKKRKEGIVLLMSEEPLEEYDWIE